MESPGPGLISIKPGWLIDSLGGEPRESMAVVVRGNHILWIGPKEDLEGPKGISGVDEPPDQWQALEMPQATLLPGLIDCHTHTNMPGDGRTGEEVDQETDDLRLLRSARNVGRALDSGVTTLCDGGAWNRTAFSLKDGIDSGLVDGPRVLVAGPPMTITGGHLWYMGGEADGVDGVRRKVRELIKEGADLIKVVASGGTTLTSYPYRPAFDVSEIKSIAEEAHTMGKVVAAHCRSTVSINNVLNAGVDLIFHCHFADSDGSYRFDQATAERLAASQVWVNPTYYLGRPRLAQLRRKQEHEGLTEEEEATMARSVDFERNGGEQFRKLTEMGVRLIGGSDCGWGSYEFGDYQGEIMSMTELGLSPMQAILAATRDAAAALGILDSVGTIEPGKEADLLLVEGNPAEDISALRRVITVFQGGRRVATD